MDQCYRCGSLIYYTGCYECGRIECDLCTKRATSEVYSPSEAKRLGVTGIGYIAVCYACRGKINDDDDILVEEPRVLVEETRGSPQNAFFCEHPNDPYRDADECNAKFDDVEDNSEVWCIKKPGCNCPSCRPIFSKPPQ